MTSGYLIRLPKASHCAYKRNVNVQNHFELSRSNFFPKNINVCIFETPFLKSVLKKRRFHCYRLLNDFQEIYVKIKNSPISGIVCGCCGR